MQSQKRKEADQFAKMRKFVGKNDVCICLRPLFHAAAHLYGTSNYHNRFFVNLNISSRYYDILFVKYLLKHNTRVVVLALEIFYGDIMSTFN